MEMLTGTATQRTAERLTGDADILQRVRKALLETGYPELVRVRVTGHEGFVFLRGAVPTYHQKQLAQEIAMHVEGVEKLKNEILVK